MKLYKGAKVIINSLTSFNVNDGLRNGDVGTVVAFDGDNVQVKFESGKTFWIGDDQLVFA